MKELPAPYEIKVFWVQVLNNMVPGRFRLILNTAEQQEDRPTRRERRMCPRRPQRMRGRETLKADPLWARERAEAWR